MTGNARRSEAIEVGNEMAPIKFDVTLTALIKYSAATWDFHPYHYDAATVRRFGLPAPLADGQMFGALMARLLMSWGGPEAFLRRLKYRVLAPVFVDETIAVSGRVTSKWEENGLLLVGASVAIAKADGTMIVRDGEAVIELPHII